MVLGVRGGDVDDVDIVIVYELAIGTIGARGAEPAGQPRRPVAVACADSGHLAARRTGDVSAGRRRDVAGAEDAPPDGPARVRWHRHGRQPYRERSSDDLGLSVPAEPPRPGFKITTNSFDRWVMILDLSSLQSLLRNRHRAKPCVEREALISRR